MQAKEKLEDLELFQQIQAGNEQAFARVRDKYFHTIYLSAYLVLHNEAEAEDIAQEVFITLWNKRHKIRVETTLPSYLNKIAHNKSLNKYKQNQKTDRRNRKYFSSTETEEQISAYEEWLDSLNELIKELPEMSRRSIQMVYWEKRSHKEVAEITGLSVNTIKTQIYTSIKNMRDKLRSK